MRGLETSRKAHNQRHSIQRTEVLSPRAPGRIPEDEEE